jgi:hypothetical protein
VSIPYWEWDELDNGGLAAENMDEREMKGTRPGLMLTRRERQMAYVQDALVRQALAAMWGVVGC